MSENRHRAVGGKSTDSQTRFRRDLAVGLYILVIAWGAVAVAWPDNGPFYLLFWAAISATITKWCIVDARVRGRVLLASFHWLIFFTYPVAVPIYLVWSRGLRGLGIAVLHAVGLTAGMAAASVATQFALHGAQWFR